MAQAGFHPVMFFKVHQVVVLFRFWTYTEYFEKMFRPIEYVLITPNNNHVHYASIKKYLDKNYGSTFIFLDWIFRTFIPEQNEPIMA